MPPDPRSPLIKRLLALGFRTTDMRYFLYEREFGERWVCVCLDTPMGPWSAWASVSDRIDSRFITVPELDLAIIHEALRKRSEPWPIHL